MAKLFERNRPPKTVMIMGHKVKVRIVPYLEDDGTDLVGAWNAETKTIYLLKGCEWKSVLLHEICHAILSLSGTGEGLSYTREESIVLALESGLGPILFTLSA